VLFPKTDLHSVHVGLQSGNIIVHDNALELIEATLTPRLRDLLVPLVDGAVSVATRVQAADRVVGLPIASASDLLRVVELIEDPLLYEEVQEALKGSLP
jgi:hypothetical protein